MTYDLVFKKAGYAFPPTATVEEVELIASHNTRWHVEIMTDQVDVFLRTDYDSGRRTFRKIATYMAGA